MKCVKCGAEFEEGIFCPECGTKTDEYIVDNESMENEDVTKKEINPRDEEKKQRQDLEYEVQKRKQDLEYEAQKRKQDLEYEAQRRRQELEIEAEKRKQEVAFELEQKKIEAERLERKKAQEQIEKERIYRERKEREQRSFNGIEYANEEEALLAAQENECIEKIKKELNQTMKQEKRREILAKNEVVFKTQSAIERFDKLKEKVSMERPKGEKINSFIGWIGLGLIILYIIMVCLANENMTIIMVGASFSIIGFFMDVVWLIRIIIISIHKKSKEYYLNIEHI